MAWVKLDDGFPTHPKVCDLSDRAFRMYVASLCYSSQHKTDGRIPEWFVRAFGGYRVLDELLRHRLWDNDPSGTWRVHDFLEYNPSAEARDAISRQRSLAGRSRQGTDKEPTTNMSLALGDGDWDGGSSTRTSLNKESRVSFERFYEAYPRKTQRRRAERAFKQALGRVDADVIIAGAERLAADPNLPEDKQFIPYPATWLNADGWGDEPLPPRNGHKSGLTAADLLARSKS